VIYPPDIPIEVCDKFLQLAHQAKAAHLRSYSADAVLHQIRWFFRVERSNSSFKCNNNWTAPLARWAMSTQPELKGFFRTRKKSVTSDWIDQ